MNLKAVVAEVLAKEYLAQLILFPSSHRTEAGSKGFIYTDTVALQILCQGRMRLSSIRHHHGQPCVAKEGSQEFIYTNTVALKILCQGRMLQSSIKNHHGPLPLQLLHLLQDLLPPKMLGRQPPLHVPQAPPALKPLQ